jgi:CBS domain containing-hemolysin-like protein
MTETPDTAARPDDGGAKKPADTGEESPSPSPPQASVADRPSLLDRLSGLFRPRNGSNLREDLTDALAESETGAESFSPAERAMLNNILRLREVRVFEQSGHSRMPVYAETLDDPRGMVHIRDVLAHITKLAKARKGRRPKKPVAGSAVLDLANVDLTRSIGDLALIRTVLFVPPSMLASDLMARMQASRTQMALVIDEYGGTDGLVSLEDIVEMVVGDIEDEHDEDVPLITQAGEGVYVVDAKAEIDDVAKLIGKDFAPGEHGDYVDTIGGMIFNSLGRVPARGEVVQAIPGFEFHVLDADPRRVKRVRIVEMKGDRRRRAAKAGQAEGAE